MTRWLGWAILGSMLVLGCAENKAASEKCKGATADTDTCNKCCTSNGATGYKYVNGSCGCLGGS